MDEDVIIIANLSHFVTVERAEHDSIGSRLFLD